MNIVGGATLYIAIAITFGDSARAQTGSVEFVYLLFKHSDCVLQISLIMLIIFFKFNQIARSQDFAMHTSFLCCLDIHDCVVSFKTIWLFELQMRFKRNTYSYISAQEHLSVLMNLNQYSNK